MKFLTLSTLGLGVETVFHFSHLAIDKILHSVQSLLYKLVQCISFTIYVLCVLLFCCCCCLFFVFCFSFLIPSVVV